MHKKPKNIKNFEGSLSFCQRCIKQRSCYSSSIGVLPRHSPFTAFHRCCFEHVLILICIYTLAALCRNLTPIEIDGAKCRVVVDLDANNIRLLFMSRGIKHTLLGLWKIGNCIILKIHHTTYYTLQKYYVFAKDIFGLGKISSDIYIVFFRISN